MTCLSYVVRLGRRSGRTSAAASECLLRPPRPDGLAPVVPARTRFGWSLVALGDGTKRDQTPVDGGADHIARASWPRGTANPRNIPPC
jgi:hypothetical protein